MTTDETPETKTAEERVTELEAKVAALEERVAGLLDRESTRAYRANMADQ